jgi:hypothetical protein
MRAEFRRYGRWILRLLVVVGFDPRRCYRGLKGLPFYLRDAIAYSRKKPSRSFRIRLFDCFPILDERNLAAGTAKGSYFHQDLWAARKIYARRPEKHIDVGSRVDGFIAHLLTFMPVSVIDIRPMESEVAGLEFVQDDATRLSSFADQSVDSISSLHAAEHFGLGRYSDPVDPEACYTFMKNLERVLRPGGRLYFAVPIGRERVEFNAHRVFSPATIVENFGRLTLVSFSAVDDDGSLHENGDYRSLQEINYGCGLFEFTKPVIV